jgi:peptidyl-prolyl cis-trans isomerase B (cyclophilin B)
VPGNKRERELARAKYERQQARKREEAAKRRRRYLVVTATVVAVVFVVGIVWLGNALGSKPPVAASKATPTPTLSAATSSPSPSPSVTAVVPTNGTPAVCAYRPGGTAAKAAGLPSTSGATKPSTRTLKLTLNGKVVTIALLASKAPCTVNSFVHLTNVKFFNNTPCHRLTTGTLAVLQCGDPTGSGNGGPGYQFNDENLVGATYTAGTVAMANAGPNTNGSQFFLVYANSQLGPQYTPFGKVIAGMNVLTAIGKAGVKGGGSDGAPAVPVTINSAVVGS